VFPSPHMKAEIDLQRCVIEYLGFRKVGKVHKPSDSDCDTAALETFRFRSILSQLQLLVRPLDKFTLNLMAVNISAMNITPSILKACT
jgi:hypothetical protein